MRHLLTINEMFERGEMPKEISDHVKKLLEEYLDKIAKRTGMTGGEYIMPLGLGNAKLIEDLTYNTQGFFDPNAKKSMNPITVSEYIELVIKLEFETKAEVGKMNDKQKAALMNGIPKLANDVLQILKKFFRLYFSKKLQQPLKHGILEA